MRAELHAVEGGSADAQQEIDPWDGFWTLYPRHIAKLDAKKAWAKVEPRDYVDILKALVVWRRVWADRGDENFIPYPASWLRGERWTDDLPAGYRPAPSPHPRPEPVPTQAPAERTPIPAHVLALIAKMKGKP